MWQILNFSQFKKDLNYNSVCNSTYVIFELTLIKNHERSLRLRKFFALRTGEWARNLVCCPTPAWIHESHTVTSQGCRIVQISCHHRTATVIVKWASCIAMQPRNTATHRQCPVSDWLIIPKIWRRHRMAVLSIRRRFPPATLPA